MELIDAPWIILFLTFCIVIFLWISKTNKHSNPIKNIGSLLTSPVQAKQASSVEPLFQPNSLNQYQMKLQPGQPSNVDTERVAGDRLGPLDPAIYQPPTLVPSGSNQEQPNLNGLSVSGERRQPNEKGLAHLGVPRIPIDYLPIPHNPSLENYQTPNFTSEGLRVDAFYKQQPFVLEGSIPKPIVITQEGKVPVYHPEKGVQPPQYERSMKPGALTTSQYQPDYWTYNNDRIQNGGNWGGILAYEPTGVDAAYPNPRLFPSVHGYYPNENPNSNKIGIPALEASRDDLRMGLGVPAYQGAFVNERMPM